MAPRVLCRTCHVHHKPILSKEAQEWVDFAVATIEGAESTREDSL